jgi:hypothetical protein
MGPDLGQHEQELWYSSGPVYSHSIVGDPCLVGLPISDAWPGLGRGGTHSARHTRKASSKSSAPQTKIGQERMPIYWGTPVYDNAFPYFGYPSIWACISIYWGTPVYLDAFPYIGVDHCRGMHPRIRGYPSISGCIHIYWHNRP